MQTRKNKMFTSVNAEMQRTWRKERKSLYCQLHRKIMLKNLQVQQISEQYTKEMEKQNQR